MAQRFDVSLKILFRYSRGIIARALFGGGEIAEWLNVELPEVRNPRVDLVARMSTGELRHVELQSGNDARLPRRTAEYYLGFWRLFNEHVTQVVLYAGREPLAMASRFRSPSMHFEFTILDLAQMDGLPLLESDDWGDNVLALLAQSDKEKVVAAVERQLRRLEGQEQADAAQTFVILSGIIGMEELIARRLENDMIDLMENKVLGPVIRQGMAQGLAQGLEQGRQEGELEGMRSILFDVLTDHFGPLPAWVLDRVRGAGREEIRQWTLRAHRADSIQALLGPR